MYRESDYETVQVAPTREPEKLRVRGGEDEFTNKRQRGNNRHFLYYPKQPAFRSNSSQTARAATIPEKPTKRLGVFPEQRSRAGPRDPQRPPGTQHIAGADMCLAPGGAMGPTKDPQGPPRDPTRAQKGACKPQTYALKRI